MHVQSCCFAYSTCCFFDVLLVVAVVGILNSLLYSLLVHGLTLDYVGSC